MRYLGKITDPKDLVNKEYIDNIAETKANIDGAYENMTVGNAEQIVSTIKVVDQAPYVFRTSGGSVDIGNREYNTHVGGTVIHNQFVTNGNFSEGDDGTRGWQAANGTLTVTSGVARYEITGTSGNNHIRATDASPNANINWINGHKYLFAMTHRENMGDGTQANSRRIRFTYVASDTVGLTLWTSEEWRRSYAVVEYTAASTRSWYGIRLTSSTRQIGDWFEVKDVMIVDLTTMFGIEIADYVYALETDTAGSGVAWLKSYGFLNKDYYATNSGERASVNASAHETVGFNQWDEEWELGEISALTGENVPNNNIIRSKNYIPIISGQTYYIKAPRDDPDYSYLQCRGYDADKNYLRVQRATLNSTFMFDEDVAYIRFQETAAYGTEYKNDICINLSWSGYRDGEYEPFVKHTYPLDDSLTLRGIPKKDASGGLYYDGDIYYSDGTVERRYGTIDLGDLSWAQGVAYGHSYFYTDDLSTLAKTVEDGEIANIINKKYPTTSAADVYTNWPEKVIASYNNFGVAQLWIVDSSYVDEAALTTALDGVILEYEVITPTTEEAEPYQSPQVVDDFGTERYVVTPQDDFEMPVGHITEYPANLRDKLQHLPDLSIDGNGTYAIEQIGTQLKLVPLVIPVELPAAPTTDGTYQLQVVVTDGVPSLTWTSI